MPKSSKKSHFVAQTSTKEMRCPHCGHYEFHVVPTRFSWLLGQRFQCTKCKGTFKRARLARIRKHEKHYTGQSAAPFHRFRRKKRR